MSGYIDFEKNNNFIVAKCRKIKYLIDEENMYRCLICEKTGKVVEYEKASSLGTHLWKTHDLKPQQYYDQYLAKPGDGKCAECGKPTKFRTIGQGYVEFCSKKCAAKHIAADAERNAHKVSMRMETVSKLDAETNGEYSKNVLESRKATMVERHGVEFYSQHKDFKDKYYATNMEKYGVKSYIELPEFQKHLQQVNIERMGVPYYFCKRKEDAIPGYTELLKKYDCELLEFGNKKEITFRCNKCGHTMTEQDLYIKSRDNLGCTPCSHCKPKDAWSSIAEDNLREYVESLGFKTEHYDRNFLDVYGADIVIESKKLIIEYDGIHWHNELYRPEDYHLMKTELAEKAGYRMIHIFSNEWENKPDIVKSRLSTILGCNQRLVYARKCEVRTVSHELSNQFMEKYHIQGECVGSTHRYGLYEGDSLLAVMTFGPSRYSKKDTELLRYCTVPGVSIVGGAGKLFKHYLKEVDPESVVTFADRRWSGNGAFYDKIGFTLVGTTEPSYYYVVGNALANRMQFQKYKLVEAGYDANKTEHEIMFERKIYRIYDCGNYKYIYKKPKVEYRPEKS